MIVPRLRGCSAAFGEHELYCSGAVRVLGPFTKSPAPLKAPYEALDQSWAFSTARNTRAVPEVRDLCSPRSTGPGCLGCRTSRTSAAHRLCFFSCSGDAMRECGSP